MSNDIVPINFLKQIMALGGYQWEVKNKEKWVAVPEEIALDAYDNGDAVRVSRIKEEEEE